MSEDVKFKSISDIEEALDNAHTYDGEPLSEHDREIAKTFLIAKYLK